MAGVYGWFIKQTATKQFVKVSAGNAISLVPSAAQATRFDTAAQAGVAFQQLGLSSAYKAVDATIPAAPALNATSAALVPTREQIIADALAVAKPHTDALTAARAAQRRFGGGGKLTIPDKPNPPATLPVKPQGAPQAAPLARAAATSPSPVTSKGDTTMTEPTPATAATPQVTAATPRATASTPQAAATPQGAAPATAASVTAKPGSMHALAQRIKAMRASYEKDVADANAALDAVAAAAPGVFTQVHGVAALLQQDMQSATTDLQAELADLQDAASPLPASSSAPSTIAAPAPASEPVTVESAAVEVSAQPAPVAPIPVPPITAPEPVAVKA